MIVTMDTNVLYAGLYSKNGASYQILNAIVKNEIQLAISVQTYFEYNDVLMRDSSLNDLNLNRGEVEDILDLLALLAIKHKIYYLLRPNLVDESDNIFVECAFSSNSDFLITSNVKHFKQMELKGFKFKIVTPSQFLEFWRKNE